MIKQHKINRSNIISIFLVLFLIAGNLSNQCITQVNAATYNNDWVIYDKDDKEVNTEMIFWDNEHNRGTKTNPAYRTVYYFMSRQPINKNEYSNSDYNRSFNKIKINVHKDELRRNSSTIWMRYSYSRDDFINAATKPYPQGLGITAADLRSGNSVVYLNPVYQRYIEDSKGNETILANNVYFLQEMLDLGWSSQTSSNLPGYYNIKYTLANIIYDVEIVAVDKNGNKILDNPFYRTEVVPNESINYNIPSDKYNIIGKDGRKYKCTEKWSYTYYGRSGEFVQETDSSVYSGTKIDFSAPESLPGKTLTVKMVYEPVEIEYKFKIVAVNEDFTPLRDLTSDGKTKNGNKLTRESSWMRTIMVDDQIYNYKSLWYYTYVNQSGTTVRVPSGSKNTLTGSINVAEMPEAKKDSTAIFYMVYSSGPTGTPTPTPKVTPTPKPTATPTAAPTATPTPFPQVPEPTIPEAATETQEFTTVITSGNLKADVRGAERFIVKQGIPTTESLYGEVTAMEYLLGYRFVKKVGMEYYTVKVTRDYILEYESATPESAGGPKPIQEVVPVSYTVTVPRPYGYWEIENLECYKIDNAVIRNYALPGEAITIYPNYSYYSPPSVTAYHSESKGYHIIPPDETDQGKGLGIKLDSITIASGDDDKSKKPSIPYAQFNDEAKYVALTRTREITVRSDSLVFNGRTVISNQLTKTEAPYINRSAIPQCTTMTNNNVLYKPNNIIQDIKKNGTYPTTGTITYTKLAKIGSSKPDNPQYIINGFDNVVIHTPVVCIPSITADNDKYVQLISPTQGCTQLVLDPDPTLSDFTVSISNTGHHSGILGYYTRDFSKSLRDSSISYIATDNGMLLNQVKLSFDTYIDVGIANEESDDKFIKAGTWITIGGSSPRLYLPMTVDEGVYTVQFRTIAVNGMPFLTNTETYANTNLSNYVAVNTLKVEVSGRIYGLSVYDLSDYPMWEEAFRVPKSLDFKKDYADYPDGTAYDTYASGRSYTYSLGTNDQYGNDTGRSNKYTFPLVNGSHPYYKNQGILKTGYMIRFSLDTIGDMYSDACKVMIKPNFYYVDKDGKNRVAVDLYYTENINNKTRNLVKVGSSLDQTNLKSYRTGDLYLGIPQAELKQTAAIRGSTYSKFTAKSEAMFNFSDIRLNYAFRTYVNNDYLNKVKAYASYADVQASGITDNDILKRMQRWYGQYYIPNEVHVVEKGFDVMGYADKYGVDYTESFWKKDGYIIVNFTIETLGEDKTRRLSYINASNYKNNGNCSMWVTEGPVLSKTSSKGPTFNFYAGDFCIYYNGKRMSDDYETGVIF